MDRGALIKGLSFGVSLAYLLDPDRGRRRRARVRDSVVHHAIETQKALGTTARDVRNRVSGTAARFGRAFRHDRTSDDVLVPRVRAEMGRVVSHPHAIEVSAEGGVVTLRGPILSGEARRLLAAVRRVPGVVKVVNQLEPHQQADHVPALQGGRMRRNSRVDLLQPRWSPTTRLLVGAGGAGLATYGATRRDVPGWLLTTGGAMLVVRAAANLDIQRLIGIGAGRRAIDIQKTITIDSPVDTVFAFWTAYENFPLFMSRVLDVRPGARERQSHWTVAGPTGAPIEFETEIVSLIPKELIAWRTIGNGSLVSHAGTVRFEPAPNDATRVTVRMSYNPPAGMVGHGIASAFGADPKSALDADLARMKTLVETGRAPHDAARR
jgi:uncharacterized membrane protein